MLNFNTVAFVLHEYNHSKFLRFFRLYRQFSGHIFRELKYYIVIVFVEPEGKRSLGRPRHRWKDGIRMNLREIGWWSVEWTQLAQDSNRWRALVNAVMNLRVLAPRS
jgi:hypothetical protein